MRPLQNYRENRGVAIVLVVGVLAVFILFFFVVGIDFAYVYVVRGELQNAADSAALAGVDVIRNVDPGAAEKQEIRDEAIKFAASNTAGGEPVELLNEDIEIGFWNGTGFESGQTPANSVKVTARKLESRGNPANLFFGRIVGWDTMDVERIAIAYKPPSPTTALSLCVESCDPGILNVPANMYFKENDLIVNGVSEDERGAAWSEFSCEKSTNFGPDSLIAKFIRREAFPPNVCGKCITTNNAAPQQIMTVLANEYNKRKDTNGNWEMVVPIVDKVGPAGCPNCSKAVPPIQTACPPGVQPDEPYMVTSYATIIINSVYLAPTPGVRLASIECTTCPDVQNLLGGVARLVK